MPPDELVCLVVRRFDQLFVTAGKAVAGTLDGNQLVWDLVLGQRLGHGRGLLVRHVGIDRAVNQEGRRVVGGDVAHRAIRIDLVPVGGRIEAGDGLRPQAILPQVMVEPSAGFALVARRAGEDLRADWPPGLIFIDERHGLAVVLRRLGVPIAVHVAIAPVGDQGRRPRLDTKAAQ